MNEEMNRPMNRVMAAMHRTGRSVAPALVISCVCLGGLGCLTPGQTQSVGRQLGEIRQQAEQVRSEQQRNVESIGAIAPVERHAAAVPIEEQTERRGGGAPLAGSSPVVTAADRGSVEEATAESPASFDERLFREGYALYHRRDYQGAEQHLRRFLAADPHGPMADDALFWIGECRFARGLYRDAIFEYRAVIDRHPDSHRVPRAWYMIALSYERLGEPAALKDHLAIVVEQFPDSDVAPLARDRLGTL
jgi:TolA-binding protein